MHGQVPTSAAAALHADIDGLADVDPSRLGDQQLCDLTAELYRAEARLAAQKLRLLAAVDSREAYRHVGAQSAGAYFSTVCRLPVGQARAQVRFARALRHLPATAERFAAGEIGEVHARAIAWHHGNERVREALERDEAMLSGEAAKLSFWLFQKALAY